MFAIRLLFSAGAPRSLYKRLLSYIFLSSYSTAMQDDARFTSVSLIWGSEWFCIIKQLFFEFIRSLSSHGYLVAASSLVFFL